MIGVNVGRNGSIVSVGVGCGMGVSVGMIGTGVSVGAGVDVGGSGNGVGDKNRVGGGLNWIGVETSGAVVLVGRRVMLAVGVADVKSLPSGVRVAVGVCVSRLAVGALPHSQNPRR